MDRYQFFRDLLASEPCYCDVDVAKDGQYVLYDNHMARVAELEAEIVALRAENEAFRVALAGVIYRARAALAGKEGE